jgi:hypothetical protein
MARGDRLRSKGGLEAMGLLRDRTRVDANPDQRASDGFSVATVGEAPSVERLDGRPMERGVMHNCAGDINKATLAVIIASRPAARPHQ